MIPKVQAVFAKMPPAIRDELLTLRHLILEAGAEFDDVGEIEEALRWGQPSYLTKWGSTIRLGWNPSSPGEYSILFNCNSKLVPTFKEIYPELFHFQGNRAITFEVETSVPAEPLKHCILLALRYHRVKNSPLLGA